MRGLTLLGLLIGLGLLAWMLTSVDLALLGDAIAAGGWAILAVSLFKLVTLGMDAAAWPRWCRRRCAQASGRSSRPVGSARG